MKHANRILFGVVVALLMPNPAAAQKRGEQRAPTDYAPYVGTYEGYFGGESFVCEVYVEDGRLIASCADEPAELLPQGDHRFGVQELGDATPEANMVVEFELGLRQADGFVINGNGQQIRVTRTQASSRDEPVPTDFTPYLGSYTGSYDGESFTCEVYTRGVRLMASCDDDEAELLPTGSHRFGVSEDEGVVVEFDVEDGKAVGFVIREDGEMVRVRRTSAR